ncbi:MAG: shikimate dehydrogenase [Verrucomicrobiota bacterium]
MAEVYTLHDLTSRELLDAGEDKPARLAVIGSPIAHSASPRMQQAALDAAGIAARYVRLEVAPGRVGEALGRMRELGFIGCNVTVPHKFEVMACCDVVDASAQALGAVNTVCFEAGQTRGSNTDGPGFVRAIADEFRVALGELKVVILGAGGGAGQALAAQCVMEGVKSLALVNRTLEKLSPVVARLQELAADCEMAALALADPALEAACAAADLIVNASSVGLKPGEAPVVPAAWLRPGQLVYDCVYQPKPTPLLEQAAARGCRTANGRPMLIHQGALAFQQWFPGSTPLAVMRAALAGPC